MGSENSKSGPSAAMVAHERAIDVGGSRLGRQGSSVGVVDEFALASRRGSEMS